MTACNNSFKKSVRCASSQPVHVPHVAEDSSLSPDTPVTASGGEFRTPAPVQQPFDLAHCITSDALKNEL